MVRVRVGVGAGVMGQGRGRRAVRHPTLDDSLQRRRLFPAALLRRDLYLLVVYHVAVAPLHRLALRRAARPAAIAPRRRPVCSAASAHDAPPHLRVDALALIQVLERHPNLRGDILALLHPYRPAPHVAPRLLLHGLHPSGIVARPLLAITQHLVGTRDLLELLRGSALVYGSGRKGEGGLGCRSLRLCSQNPPG